jgi:hypothetical protein
MPSVAILPQNRLISLIVQRVQRLAIATNGVRT